MLALDPSPEVSSCQEHCHKEICLPYAGNEKAAQPVSYQLFVVPSQNSMSRIARKPVFDVSDQVRHKLGCTSTEDD